MTDMNEIATIAAQRYRKDSPDQKAIDNIKIIMESASYPADFLAPIYAYMVRKQKAPSKKAETDAWSWVSLAIGKHDTRTCINYVYSDGARLIGTDGERLHIVHDVNMPVGWYDKNKVLLDNTETEWRYPDIDRVIPKDDLRSFSASLDTLGIINVDSEYPVYAMPCGRCINVQYLRDATAGMNGTFEYWGIPDAEKPLLIRHGKRIAVIAPIRA